jgi:hypothetical protein
MFCLREIRSMESKIIHLRMRGDWILTILKAIIAKGQTREIYQNVF